MKLYFLRSAYKDNVYKISDFYTGSSINKNENRMFNLNFKADDGATSVVCPTDVLPDSTAISTYSHVYAEDANKIYMIQRTEYVNGSQVKLWLIEDALIANYMTLKDDNLLIERTNDMSKFTGIHDVSEIGLDYDAEIHPIHKPTNTGKWLLYFLKITNYDKLAGSYKVKLKLNINIPSAPVIKVPSYFDSVDNIADLMSKYPSVVTTTPESYFYFNKRVSSAYEGKVYESVYYAGVILWREAITTINLDTTTDSDTELNVTIPPNQITSRFPDGDYVVLAFPYEGRIAINDLTTPYDSNVLVSAEQLRGIVVEPGVEILETKVVDESLLFDSTTHLLTLTNFDEDGPLPWKALIEESALSGTFKSLRVKEGSTEISYQVPDRPARIIKYKVLLMTGFNTQIENGIRLAHNGFNMYEPFKKYELNIYGNIIPIPAVLLNEVKISFTLAIGIVNYTVYLDKAAKKVLATGSFTLQSKYNVDQLDAFNQQNPTYKDQFTASMFKKGVESIGVGAVLGGPAGAAKGALTTTISAGFAIHNENLRQKGLSLMPDQMYGDSSSTSFLFNNWYGMFLIVKTAKLGSMMVNEYYLRGFPTGVFDSLDGLVSSPNTIYGPCKYVQGRLLKRLVNPFVTAEVDKKLQEGVVIIT